MIYSLSFTLKNDIIKSQDDAKSWFETDSGWVKSVGQHGHSDQTDLHPNQNVHEPKSGCAEGKFPVSVYITL